MKAEYYFSHIGEYSEPILALPDTYSHMFINPDIPSQLTWLEGYSAESENEAIEMLKAKYERAFSLKYLSYSPITPEQFHAFERLKDNREIHSVTLNGFSDPYLAVRCNGIFIGIEPDGYTHS